MLCHFLFGLRQFPKVKFLLLLLTNVNVTIAAFIRGKIVGLFCAVLCTQDMKKKVVGLIVDVVVIVIVCV